jgi:hypothetical protein
VTDGANELPMGLVVRKCFQSSFFPSGVVPVFTSRHCVPSSRRVCALARIGVIPNKAKWFTTSRNSFKLSSLCCFPWARQKAAAEHTECRPLDGNVQREGDCYRDSDIEEESHRC